MSIFQQVLKTRELNTYRYREWYQREKRPRFYHPYLHLGFNLGILMALITAHFILVENWNFYSVILLAGIFLLGNFTVWFVHKYPLHRRIRFWSFPYDAHTVEHHRYFTADAITYDSHQDYVAIFFPSMVIFSFAVIAQPLIYFGTNFLAGPDHAHVLAGGAAGYFLMYELFHWASHLPSTHPLMKIPWVNYMREHHRIHHSTRLMNKYNFCIVYPLMDIIMGTKYSGSLPDENVEDHFRDVTNNFKGQK